MIQKIIFSNALILKLKQITNFFTQFAEYSKIC